MSDWLTGDESSLARWRRWLMLRTQKPADDADLAEFAAFVQGLIERRCGPIAATTVVDVLPAGSSGVVSAIPSRPLVGVSDGLPGDYVVSGQLLRRADGGSWSAPLTVTYTAGWAQPPAWALMAARFLGVHLWGSWATGNAGAAGAAWTWPRQAEDAIAGHELVQLSMGFA